MVLNLKAIRMCIMVLNLKAIRMCIMVLNLKAIRMYHGTEFKGDSYVFRSWY